MGKAGEADDMASGSDRRGDAGLAVLDDEAGPSGGPCALGGLDIDVGRRFALGYVLKGGDAVTEEFREPGDAEGDGWGEVMGARNGFKALWIRREDFVN